MILISAHGYSAVSTQLFCLKNGCMYRIQQSKLDRFCARSNSSSNVMPVLNYLRLKIPLEQNLYIQYFSPHAFCFEFNFI